jgi:hypothetical protein
MEGVHALASPGGGAESHDRMDHPQYGLRGVKNILPAMSFATTGWSIFRLRRTGASPRPLPVTHEDTIIGVAGKGAWVGAASIKHALAGFLQ